MSLTNILCRCSVQNLQRAHNFRIFFLEFTFVILQHYKMADNQNISMHKNAYNM